MHKRTNRLICFLATVILFTMVIVAFPSDAIANTAPDRSSDDFINIRTKYSEYLIGGRNIDLSDPYIAAKIKTTDYYKTMNEKYVWDDLEEISGSQVAYVNRAYERVLSIAIKWSTPGSIYYQDEAVKNALVQSMEWIYNNRYNPQLPSLTNWWYYKIGVPYDLLGCTIVLYDVLSEEQRIKYAQAVDYYVSGPLKTDTGANLADICAITILKGAVLNNVAEVEEGVTALYPLFEYAIEGDGMYEDGSYPFHNHFASAPRDAMIPYNGHYGMVEYKVLAQVLWLTAGTTWEYNVSNINNFYDSAFKAFAPFLHMGKWLLPVKGRLISHSLSNVIYGTDVTEFIGALYMVSELPNNPRASDLKGFIKYQINQGGKDAFYRSVTNIWEYDGIKNNVMNNPSITEYRISDGNRQFHNMDVVTHHRPNWLFINRMHSTRIANWEFVGQNGKKQWYTGDGATYVYSNVNDYLNNWIWALDFHRVPGTTVDRWIDRPLESIDDTKNPSYRSFVGGVNLENLYGVASMDFKQHDVKVVPAMDVRAKKSWFMFDDEVVAIGSGVNSTSGRGIETIVDNRVIKSDGSNALTVNGIRKPVTEWSETMDKTNWIHLEGTGGYYFPGSATIKGLREKRIENMFQLTNYAGGSDDFSGKVLIGSWKREDNKRYRYTGDGISGNLRIITQNGTLQGPLNTTRNLLLKTCVNDGKMDFIATVKLKFSPTQVRQEAGQMLYMNDDNYISVSRAYTNSGKKIVIGNEENGVYTETTIEDTFEEEIYLRIEKEDNKYTGWISDDENEWNKIGSVIHTFPPELILKIGFFAQNNDSSADEIEAVFDDYVALLSGKFVTLWFDHGIDPIDDTYQYVLLPTMTATQVESYTNNPDIEVISDTPQIHAVREKTLGITGMTFWNTDGGMVENLFKSNQKSCVMIKDTGRQYSIAVSDPTHKQAAMSFEILTEGIAKISADSGVTVTQLTPTIKFMVDSAGSKGKAFNLKIEYRPHIFFQDDGEVSQWAMSYIRKAQQLGILQGDSDNKVYPQKNISRAEFITLLMRTKEDGEKIDDILNFNDVSPGAWYCKEVKKALVLGIIKGKDEFHFRPDDPVTRQEAAVIISKFLKLPQNGISVFTDERDSHEWASKHIDAVYAAGIMKGSHGKFHPNQLVTREMAIKIITDVYGKMELN